jgi:RimJ/RimL family protein N-acetyltransferase
MPELIGSVLFGADEFVGTYVQAKLGSEAKFAGGYSALGVVRRGVFIGGVVYHNFLQMPFGNAVEVSFAFDDPSWALPQTMRTICSYPYLQLSCVRVTAIVAKGNKRSRQMVEWIGFKREGVHPKGIDGKQTAISYGMLREDCRWIKERDAKSRDPACASGFSEQGQSLGPVV